MAKTRNARRIINWAIELPLGQAPSAANLLISCQAEVLIESDSVWLRGTLDSTDVNNVLKLIPGASCWLRDELNRLTRIGKIVPDKSLPDGPWMALSTWLQLVFPIADSPIAGTIGPVELKVRRTGPERAANLLVCAFDDWANYAETAPQWRLECTRFAANASRQVAIHGTPLPPLAGEHFVEHEGVAIAAGWCLSPTIESALIRRWLGLNAGDLALIRPAKDADVQTPVCWERLSSEQWVAGSRSSVRGTREDYYEC